jgi:hypothetical protein
MKANLIIDYSDDSQVKALVAELVRKDVARRNKTRRALVSYNERLDNSIWRSMKNAWTYTLGDTEVTTWIPPHLWDWRDWGIGKYYKLRRIKSCLIK